MHAARETDADARERRIRAAVEVADRVGDAALRFAALAQLGETLVLTGRVEEGMLRFDESLAAVFCGMFLTCERVHDVVRAEQWLRAAGDLVRRRNLIAVSPLCRAHYGGLLAATRAASGRRAGGAFTRTPTISPRCWSPSGCGRRVWSRTPTAATSP